MASRQEKPAIAAQGFFSQSSAPEGARAPATLHRVHRQIFVAYPYTVFPEADYRKVFRQLEKPFQVKFVFADEKITTLHILTKIYNYIRESEFGIYDISGWNPNVTLELGLAYGLGEDAYIAMNPSKTDIEDVPADLRGIDRLQYRSYSELGEKLEALLAQELPLPRTHEAENQLAALRTLAVKLIAGGDGPKIGDIAGTLNITVDLAKVVMKPLLADGTVRLEGVKKGARYYPPDR